MNGTVAVPGGAANVDGFKKTFVTLVPAAAPGSGGGGMQWKQSETRPGDAVAPFPT